MNVVIYDNKMSMAFLGGLPNSFDSIVRALYAVGDDEKQLTFAYVSRSCEQEEQRHQACNKQALVK